jgi:hypothetical protein
VKKLMIAAMVAAFGTAVVLPTAAIIGSDGAFAAQKTAKKKAEAGTRSASLPGALAHFIRAAGVPWGKGEMGAKDG